MTKIIRTPRSVPFGAYLPLVLEGGGELLDGHVIVDGIDGDDGDLGVCLAIDLKAEVFDALPDGGGKDTCKVIDDNRLEQGAC